MLKMYSSKRQWARANRTKLVSLIRVRLLSSSGFVGTELLKLFSIIREKIGWIMRRCELARSVGRLVGRSIGRTGERSRYVVIAELRPVENRDDKPQDGGVLGNRDLTLSGSAIEKCAIISTYTEFTRNRLWNPIHRNLKISNT